MITKSTLASVNEKPPAGAQHEENETPTHASGDLVYDNDEEEPELHARTWVALIVLFLLNYVQIIALQGPPTVLSIIGTDLDGTASQTWVANAPLLMQAVLSPLIASISDLFQSRKTLLVVMCTISCVGAAIAPGSNNISRLIGAQIMIGIGFSTTSLSYCIPSEIVPRKWRPVSQASMNVAAGLASCSGPLIIGAMTSHNRHTGWRNYFWLQMALWGIIAVGIQIGYRPPKRHTRYDHLSFLLKLQRLDLIGFGLLLAGLTLTLSGLNLGGGLYPWNAAATLAPLIIGIALLIVFGLYEWKGTKTGILSHEFFRGGQDAGRSVIVCLVLMFIEGIAVFSVIVVYPILTTAVFEVDPFLEAARGQPFWIALSLSTVCYGYASTKLRSIKIPLFVGWVIFTGGAIALATVQPADNTRILIYSALAGAGFGAPLVLIIAGIQLASPHHLIATATGLTVAARSLGGTVFVSVYAALITSRTGEKIPAYVASAALKAGLPPKSLMAFVGALATNDAAALPLIPGVTPAIIGAGVVALKQAFADSIRVVYIIAAVFPRWLV